MVIRKLLLGMMMNEQEPCSGGDASHHGGGGLIRRTSKDWMLVASNKNNAVGAGGGALSGSECDAGGNVVCNSKVGDGESLEGIATASQTLTSALSSISSSSSSTPNSSSQFRELIEMLLYCYLEYGGTHRSEQFRNLVEVFLCPVFENANNRCSASSPSTSSTVPVTPPSATSCITSVVTPAPAIPPCLQLSDSLSSCNSNNSAASCSDRSSSSSPSLTSVESSCTSSPPSSKVIVTSGGGSCTTASAGKSNGGVVKGAVSGEGTGADNDLLCPVCYGILVDPVTIQCGHSYCKKCLQKEVAGHSCRRCSHLLTCAEAAQCKTNVLLGGLVEKWWPDHVTATNLRNEGNKMFEGKQVDKALSKYTQALALVPNDHLSLGNRSNCLLTAGKSEEALQDAELAIKCCPVWPKGYFRKSAAMISLGRYEEAFLSLTVCMYLMKLSCSKKSPSSSPEDPARAQVTNEMIKILQKIFLQSASAAVGSTLKRHNLSSTEHINIQYCPYPGARRRSSTTSTAFNHQDWNDSSEYNSSGDESDHVIQAHHHHGHYQHSWKSNRTCHRQLREQTLQRSLSSPTMVEQLSFRMSRLFSRARHDLKSFENRLRGGGGGAGQRIKSMLRVESPQEVSSNDLECSLCYRLLFQPVSTECGHTFCRSCLDRCMDHNPACPLCKTGLQSYLACREHAVTRFLEAAIKSFLPREYDERLKQHMEELNSVAHAEGKDLDVDISIFVCTMAFPTIPCPLHVFEPRYRLMIRRCMENGSNRFGMCCYFAEGEHNYGEIGTLLEIRNIQYFADGRSVVDTVGCRRFKVLHKNVVDGYNAARIELLHDKPVLENEVTAVNELHDKVLKEATEWLQSIGQVRRQRIHSHFGQMPCPEEDWIGSPDGPSWTWWLLAILPLDSKAQLAILSMCSLQKRLECILKVLSFVKNRMGSIGE